VSYPKKSWFVGSKFQSHIIFTVELLTPQSALRKGTPYRQRKDKKLSYRQQIALSSIYQSFRSNTTVDMFTDDVRHCNRLRALDHAVCLRYRQ